MLSRGRRYAAAAGHHYLGRPTDKGPDTVCPHAVSGPPMSVPARSPPPSPTHATNLDTARADTQGRTLSLLAAPKAAPANSLAVTQTRMLHGAKYHRHASSS
eukprot:532866-Prymnesium_polylepis.1